MNPVRLEIIQDDPTTAPRLSRTMPAALYQYVPETSFAEFRDKIDALLRAAATDYRCRANRSSWWINSVMFWFYWFIIMIFNGLFTFDSGIPDRFYKMMVISIVICVLHLGAMIIWMNRSTGAKPATETLSEIRTECLAMSTRTPCASFHLVTSRFSMILVRQYLNKVPIEYIEVSISASGFEVANGSDAMIHTDTLNTSKKASSGVPHPAVQTTSAVTNDYRQLDLV